MIRRMTYIIPFLLLLSAPVARNLYAGTGLITEGEVTYTTSRSVYIALDESHSLAADDSVYADVDERVLTPVRVKAVSGRKLVIERHSYLSALATGDTIFIQIPTSSAKALPAASQNPENKDKKAVTSSWNNPFSGRMAFQYYRYRGDGGNREYDQPSVYLDTRYTGFSSAPLSLNLRLRTRLQRDLQLPDGKETHDDRTDRLYDLSIEYGGRNSAYYAGIGRIRSIRVGGMGGIDGFVFEKSISTGLSGGVFGGVAPELDNFIGDKNALKRGGYVRWRNDSDSDLNMELITSYIAENENGRPTEHLLYFEHSLYYRTTLSMNHEAVLNVKTAEKGREAETLQNFRSYFNYTPMNFLRVNGSYYAYLVQEYRDLDRVTDPVEEIRYGHAHTFMPGIEATLPQRIYVSSDILVGKDNVRGIGVLSFAVRCRAGNILGSGFSGSISQIETSHNTTNGHHTMISLSRSLASGPRIILYGSEASYESAHTQSYRIHQLRAGLSHTIGKSFYCSGYYTRSLGRFSAANQFFVEWGVRLKNGK